MAMTLRLALTLLLCTTVACADDADSTARPGGEGSTGGVPGTGEARGTGGATGTGGALGTGGVTGTGGALGTGGATGTGGVQGAGGAPVAPPQPEVFSASGPGTVTPTWQDFCVATFHRDHQVSEKIGNDDLFVAMTGDQYLFTSRVTLVDGTTIAGLEYLTEYGLFRFDVEAPPNDAPYSLNCDHDAAVRHVGVIVDTTLYSDDTLDSVLCTLDAGAALPGETRNSITAGGVDQVAVGPFSDQCQGAEWGYLVAPRVDVLGQRGTTLIPLRTLIGAG